MGMMKKRKTGILISLMKCTFMVRSAEVVLVPDVTQLSAVMTVRHACGLGLLMTLQAGDLTMPLAAVSPNKEHQKDTITAACPEIRELEPVKTAVVAARRAGPKKIH